MIIHQRLACTGARKGVWGVVAWVLLAAAPAAHAGTIIGGERIGLNFNNRYADGDTKTDYLGYSFDQADPTFIHTLNDLDTTVSGGYGNLRLGFSRNMAADPTDLAQWIDQVELAINSGRKVMVAGWFQSDFNDTLALTDADLWKNVIDGIDARGIMHGISGWEIQNEPIGAAADWRSYMRKIWKKVGGYESQGWNQLDAAERAQIAAAWYDKPIVVQGLGYGQNFNTTELVDGLAGMNNLVWSTHHYSKFSGINTTRENYTVEQWRDHYVNKWTNAHADLGGNIVVTELGLNNFDKTLTGMGPAGTTADDRRDAGFALASRDYYGQSNDTTIFWYTAYNVAPIGLGNTWESSWRFHSRDATNYVFSGDFEPAIPAGTTNVVLGKTASASDTSSGYSPAFAVDGIDRDSASRWLSLNNDADHWLQIDLDGLFEISEARIFTGFDQYEQAISNYSLQRYVGGVWEDIMTVTDNNNPALILSFAPIQAEILRLFVPAATDNRVRLFELEVYGVEIVPIEGDFDGDGFVGLADLDLILGSWNQVYPRGGPPWDANQDGFIGLTDLDVVLNNWNAGTPPASSAIPEPATMLWLAAGTMGIASRHRIKH